MHYGIYKKVFSIVLMVVFSIIFTSFISTQTASGALCNCVVFRLDDVQDDYMDNVQKAILDTFATKNQNVSLGIIMHEIGSDPVIMTEINEGLNPHLYELSLHGWDHVDYKTLTRQQQKDSLIMANNKMVELFGRPSKIFVLPYNRFNNDTLSVMNELNIKVISSEIPSDHYPFFVANGSNISDQYGRFHLPQMTSAFVDHSNDDVRLSVAKVLSDINNFTQIYGYTIVTMHPPDFAIKTPGQPTIVNASAINDLSNLIDSILASGKRITTFTNVTGIGYLPITPPPQPIIHMQDTTPSSGLSTYSGRQIHAEFVTPASQLVGDQIDTIVIKMRKTGLPTGIAQIGVFNSDLSVKKLFGTKDSATLTTSYADYNFSLQNQDLYTIQAGDRIGIKFAGGNVDNRIATMTDQDPADPFDGANSYHTYYTTSWNNFPTNDMYMILKKVNTTPPISDTTPPITTALPAGGSYSTPQLVVLSANEPATIRYTLDGTEPDVASPIYLSPILIDTNTTLKFSSIDAYGNAEQTKTELYTIITDTTPPVTTANPTGGTYFSIQNVALSTNEPATIYYTTDGTTPTTSSSVYTTPISISASTTLKFFARDTAGNSENVKTEIYTINILFPIIHMQDTTPSSGLSTYSGRQIHAEFVTPASQLVGDQIDTIVIKMRKTGLPTGIAQIGVFNSDLSVKKLFGTKDSATLTGSYTDYTFALPLDQSYTIQAGDRIGIKFAGGNVDNRIATMTDQDPADPFDGANSYHTYYTTSWNNFPTNDMYMILKQTHN